MGISTLASCRVCFVCYQAYPLLGDRVQFKTGGMERRAVLFARSLSQRPDVEVSFLTANHGQSWGEAQQDLRLYPYPSRAEELRRRVRQLGLPAMQWRASWELPLYVSHRVATRVGWDFLKETQGVIRDHATRAKPRRFYADIPADVFCGFGVNWLSAEMVASCRDQQRTSVLLLSSDEDLDPVYATNSNRRGIHGTNGALGYGALRDADVIVAQTKRQQHVLSNRFGRRATVIRNPVDVQASCPRDPSAHGRSYVLWVGRAEKDCKRADVFLHVAAQTPEIQYVCVMNRATGIVRSGDHFDELVRSAPKNVQILEYVPPDMMEQLFKGAVALVSTSAYEGFPNTFLQAGLAGVAVVSLTVDPDEILSRNGYGLVAGDSVDKLIAQLRAVWSDREMAAALGARLRQHVLEHHDLPGRVEELASLLHSLTQQRRDRCKVGKSSSFTGT